MYERKQAFYATTKAREKRHGHLPCDAREESKTVPPIPYIQNDQVAKAKEYATKLLEVKPDDDTAKQIMAL